MKVLVTGAGGMLGRDVVRAAHDLGHEVVAAGRAALDVTDAGAVDAAIAAAELGAGDAVVNCAAWTDVDGAESDPAGAAAVNATAAGTVARAAATVGARLVHVSTDYVFDGRQRMPYVESDTPSPQSVYGRTKLDGERAVMAAGGSHAVVRSSWLFGIGGPNFAASMLKLAAERDEVTVVTDQIGCPTATAHLAPALLELAQGDAQGIFHVAGAGRCSWNDFATEIFRQADTRCRVLPCTTADMPRPAPRPANSALVSERPETPSLPTWQEGVSFYLAARKAVHA